jgi:tight adherence protein C
MVITITACVFVAVLLLVLGITMRSQREIIRDRMETHGTIAAPLDTGSVELEAELPFGQRVVLPILRSLSLIGGRLTPGGTLQVTDEKLETAGRPWGLGAREFLGLKVLSIIVLTILGIAAAKILATTVLLRFVLLALFFFIGFILPDYMLQQTINNRQSSVRKMLADTLDLLTVSVEAGLGLDGAMQKVIEKLHSPLSDEMARALQEMRVGKLRTEALRDMAHRVKVAELTIFVAAICQADQLGISIAKVLRVQGDTLRTQRAQRAREAASKLPVKMLFPLVLFIFPAIFVVILAPGAIGIGRALGIIK